MTILGYQFVVAMVIIVPAAIWGRTALLCATALAAIWTVTHIFAPWLMALQGLTICIAFSIAKGIVDDRERQRR